MKPVSPSRVGEDFWLALAIIVALAIGALSVWAQIRLGQLVVAFGGVPFVVLGAGLWWLTRRRRLIIEAQDDRHQASVDGALDIVFGEVDR